MSFAKQLESRFPNRIERPSSASDIPSSVFFAYVLAIDDTPIVVGHGKKDRARIIFDSKDYITPNHLKALIVRLHLLFGPDGAVFDRFLIRCASKQEAKEIENGLHREFGGNTRRLPESIHERLFSGLDEDSLVRMVLRMALCSSFDGISDLKRWRREGIIGDENWREIAGRLFLPSN